MKLVGEVNLLRAVGYLNRALEVRKDDGVLLARRALVKAKCGSDDLILQAREDAKAALSSFQRKETLPPHYLVDFCNGFLTASTRASRE